MSLLNYDVQIACSPVSGKASTAVRARVWEVKSTTQKKKKKKGVEKKEREWQRRGRRRQRGPRHLKSLP